MPDKWGFHSVNFWSNIERIYAILFSSIGCGI